MTALPGAHKSRDTEAPLDSAARPSASLSTPRPHLSLKQIPDPTRLAWTPFAVFCLKKKKTKDKKKQKV
ncbi:hypothetical protein PV394_04560, partial [Streptomyces sp. NE06-03E]|uniref:hypothetical protein n=1 Tax=Streptomyces sp. NE06-03E TaxID=3028695 RepID=UPI0029A2CBFE